MAKDNSKIKAKVKPNKDKETASRGEDGSSADISTTSANPCFCESGSPSTTVDDYSTTANDCGQDTDDSLSSTPSTSASNSPAPTSKGNGLSRPSRAAKNKASESLAKDASSASELDTSSDSDFLNLLMSESESDIDCPSATESDYGDDDSSAILPAAKRVKLSPRLPAPKPKFKPCK